MDLNDLINGNALAKMKDGVIIMKTSRGGLVTTQALIEGIKSLQKMVILACMLTNTKLSISLRIFQNLSSRMMNSPD